MAQVLDRSRPFAEVHGISDVRYEQDGLPFDYAGNLMVAEEPKKRGRQKQTVVDQVAANLEDVG